VIIPLIGIHRLLQSEEKESEKREKKREKDKKKEEESQVYGTQ
jgi:hypothetical protein